MTTATIDRPSMSKQKPGPKPTPPPDDPLDHFTTAKVRVRVLRKAKQVAAHRGEHLHEYLDKLLAPAVQKDFEKMLRDAAKE